MPRMIAPPCRFLFSLILIAAAGIVSIRAAETPAVVVAIQVKGTVEVQHGTAGSTETVTEGRQLAATDIVTTAKSSSVVLVLENGSVVSLRENSRLKITTALQTSPAGTAPAAKDAGPQESGASNTGFELAFGEMLARVRKLNPSSTFEVQTPVSVAAVRGTVFEVAYRAGETGPSQYRLSTASGLVHVTPRGGELVKVAADEQMEFAARVRGKRMRIQPVKNSKLSPQKRAQLEKEAQDVERGAGDVVKRAQTANAAANAKMPPRVDDKAKDPAPDKARDAANTAKENPKEASPDKSKPAATPAVKKKKAPDPNPKK
ncbi:MAG: hypothetical protein EXS37_18860 [Opitutus sp.]|nr:hypothetical protein [Opitutus sp.]